MLQMPDTQEISESVDFDIQEYRQGRLSRLRTPAIREIPLTIFLNGREVVTLLCAGRHPRHLALGFLKSDALVRDPEEVRDVAVEVGEQRITARVELAGDPWTGRILQRSITSGCGKGTNFDRNLSAVSRRRIQDGLAVDPADILRLAAELRARSTLHAATRGCHNSSLCTCEAMLLFREDIGRHNAIDMIVGHCFEHHTPAGDKMVVTTGRVASEILLKVARIGAPVLAATGRATSMAADLARRIGVTLVGNVHEDSFWVYHDPGRIRTK